VFHTVLDHVGQRLRAPVEVAGKANLFATMDHEALLLDLERDLQRFQRPFD